MAGAGAPGALIARPLCVKCRTCGRKSAFASTSVEARAPEAATVSRLVCHGCGARAPRTIRLCDDREAARWLADR